MRGWAGDMGREGRDKIEVGGGKIYRNLVCGMSSALFYFVFHMEKKREYLGLSKCVVIAA